MKYFIIISKVTGQNQAVCHLSCATNPILSNFMGNLVILCYLTFKCKIILKQAISLNIKQILRLNYCRKQLKLKNYFKICLDHLKFQRLLLSAWFNYFV